MSVEEFAEALLPALSRTGVFEQVRLETEGPIAEGRAYVREDLFLRFYFNEITGTMAFALVSNQQRIWGIDTDNRRGWHCHPIENPGQHRPIEPLSVPEIVDQLAAVLQEKDF